MSVDENKIMVMCDNIVKIYKTGDLEVVALQGLDLTIEKGELIAIIGNSGSGKSTLLNMLGGLDVPSAGKLLVDGIDLTKLDRKRIFKYKRETVGFVWQNSARNLVPYLTASENVEVPMVISGKKKRCERALELLEMVGLISKKDSKLYELSGGEQQRVAIAIALANNPKLLLADEPTGSIDTKTAGTILDIFQTLNKMLAVTIIIVTHDRHISHMVNRVVAIRDGRTSSEFVRPKSYLEELEKTKENFKDSEHLHEEFIIVDKTGRLQIPSEYLDAIGIKGKSRIKAEVDGNKIILYPEQ